MKDDVVKKVNELCEYLEDIIENESDFKLKADLRVIKSQIKLKYLKNEPYDSIVRYLNNKLRELGINNQINGIIDGNNPLIDDNSANEKKSNPYDFTYDTKTEEEMLKSYIEGDIPVFLHGLSGCGKSARIKKIDPDCTIIYLSSAKPETLSGRGIVTNGEIKDVPPVWYQKLCKKCEDEPNKIHILFFDEITNAPPSLQGLAYNIILDKEVNGKWKLPDNCRIVAAGNDQEESLSANEMSEPLFRRFAHVNINTTVQSWIIWASEARIHPAIISFILSNGLENNPVFRTKCGGKNPCVDPRKWEMASKLLKKNGNPRELVGILGRDITNLFSEFVKNEVISLNNVLSGDYDKNMIRIEPDKGWRVIHPLCGVDSSNVETVINFINKYMYPEHLSIFTRIWTANGTDKKRVNILQEIKIKNEMLKENNQEENTDNMYFKRGA